MSPLERPPDRFFVLEVDTCPHLTGVPDEVLRLPFRCLRVVPRTGEKLGDEPAEGLPSSALALNQA